MVAAVANANTVFLMSEASILPELQPGRPAIVSRDRGLRKGRREI
jgi:hypothetical protein